ncbi:MAG: hypothetical protein U0Z70_06370 [Thermomicrobiales bacterium]
MLSQHPFGQLVASQTQAMPLQCCPSRQLPASHAHTPLSWQTCPGEPQSWPTKAGLAQHCPVVASQIWQAGQGPQSHGPQSTIGPHLLATWPQRPTQVRAADFGLHFRLCCFFPEEFFFDFLW